MKPRDPVAVAPPSPPRAFGRRRLKVYVAGPMTVGSLYEHMVKAMAVGRQMVHEGLAPYVPHLDAFMFPGQDATDVGWNAFLEWDLEWVASSDAVYRLKGESKGADLECEVATSLGLPVFYEGGWELTDYDALLRYACERGLDGVRK